MLVRIFLLLFICPLFSYSQHVAPKDSVAMLSDTIRLGEVSVWAGAENPRAISGMLTGNISLSAEGVKVVPSLTGTVDMLKVFELTPSVRTSGDGSTNMYVRGGDAGQNQILYNGARSYTSGHILGIFPLFNGDHLSSTMLFKTGVDASYGDFLSSVIDATSKREIPKKISLKGNVGLLASQASIDLPITSKWGAYVSARKTYLELLLKPMLENNKISDNDDSDIAYGFWDGNISVIGELNDRHRLAIDLSLGDDKLDLTDDEILIDGTLKWQSNIVSASLESRLCSDAKLSQTLSYSHFENKLSTKQEEMRVGLTSQIKDIGYKNKLDTRLGNVSVSIGSSYTYHEIKPHRLSMSNSGVTTNSQQEEKTDSHAVGLFLSTNIRLIDKLSISPGLRYNYFYSELDISRKSKTYHSLDTRLSLLYELISDKYLKASYSHNNQYINKLTPSSVGLPTDFWISASNNIEPQRGNEFSVGYYQALFDGGVEFSTDVYYRTMTNVTQFDYNFIENDNTSFSDKIAFGKGRAYGLEVMLKKNFGKLTGWLGYSLAKADRQFDEINKRKRFRARFDRTHDLSLTLNYKFSAKLDASLTYIYATGNTYTQPTSWYFINNLPVKEYTEYNNASMPNYNRADIGVNYWFKRNNGLNFSLYNMFSVDNPIYVFMVVKESPDKNIEIEMKRKKLFGIIPSVSWNFKF